MLHGTASVKVNIAEILNVIATEGWTGIAIQQKMRRAEYLAYQT